MSFSKIKLLFFCSIMAFLISISLDMNAKEKTTAKKWSTVKTGDTTSHMEKRTESMSPELREQIRKIAESRAPFIERLVLQSINAEEFRNTLDKGGMMTESSVLPLLTEAGIIKRSTRQSALQIHTMPGGAKAPNVFRVSFAVSDLVNPKEIIGNEKTDTVSLIIKNLPSAPFVPDRTGRLKLVRDSSGKLTGDKEETSQEILNVVKVAESRVMKLDFEGNSRLPIIKVSLKAYYYPFSQEGQKTVQKNYIEILSAASGKAVVSLFHDWLANQKSEYDLENGISKVEDMLSAVSRALGEFHYSMASPEEKEKIQKGDGVFLTVVHGDAGPNNIFYNPATRKVTFIDTSDMATSLKKPLTNTRDMRSFIGNLRYDWNGIFRGSKIKSDITFKDIVDTDIARGYAQAFPKEVRESIENTIKDL